MLLSVDSGAGLGLPRFFAKRQELVDGNSCCARLTCAVVTRKVLCKCWLRRARLQLAEIVQLPVLRVYERRECNRIDCLAARPL